MEFWVVPNNAGLPTVSLEQALATAGVSPQTGKNCTVQKVGSGAQSIPDSTRTALEFDEIIHDDLGFFDIGEPTRLTIPDVDPPIRAVRLFGDLNWDVSAALNVEYILFADTPGGGNLGLTPASFFSNFVVSAVGNQPLAWGGASGAIANIGGNGQFPLAAGQFFEFTVRQDSGVAVDAGRVIFSIDVLR